MNWLRELPKPLLAHQFILITAAAVAIVIDQLTKWWVEANIRLHTHIAPFESVAHIFDLLHVKNPGAAFGTGAAFGWLFTTIAFVVCGGILFYNRIILGQHSAFRIALGLIMGGALGNVIDRFRLGEVTDFIHFDFTPLVSDAVAEMIPLLNFAIFNMADTFIFSGVCIMFWLLWKDRLPDDPWTESEEESAQALKDWQQSIPAAARPAKMTSRASDNFQLSYGASAPTGPSKKAADKQKEATHNNGRFGLKTAIFLGASAFLIILFLVWRRQNKH